MNWILNLPLMKKFKNSLRTFAERDTRVCLYHSDVFFKPMYAGAESPQQVVNISFGGVGLDTSKFSPLPEVGEVLPGQLLLGEEAMDLSLKVIHNNNNILGCQFLEAPSHLRSTLYKYLQTEISAHQLIQIDSKVLQQRDEGTPYYFRGQNRDELYYVIKNKKIKTFNFIIDDFYFSGGEKNTFRFGRIKKMVDEKVHGFKREDPVEWLSHPDSAYITKIQKFLDNIKTLNPSHKEILIKMISMPFS